MTMINSWKNFLPYYTKNHIDSLFDNHTLSIPLGSCTSLGYGNSQNGPVFSWKDPDNVELNGSLLTQWDKTVLVRKIGSYPSNHQDGEIIATTSYDLENKNYYKTHNFIDTTQEQNITYYYKLFSKSKLGVWNNLVQNEFSNGLGLNWYQVQNYVRAGRGAELFPVGTVFYVDHSEYTHQDGSGIIFRVSGHDQVPTTNPNLTHSMCLQMVEVLFNAQYDASQNLYAITQDETAQSDKTYYTYDNSIYTELVQGTDYQIGDSIPISSWYQKNIDQNRASYGSNNPKQSNLIQWANSNGNAKQWFSKQTIWDNCGSVLYNKNGFLKYLDQDFLNVVQNANIIRCLCNAQGGSSTTISTKFFPLSKTQVFNSTSNNIYENTQLSYYANGGSSVKYLMNTESSSVWWLGSPYVDNTGHVYIVTASGTLNYLYVAHNTYGVSLACIIA